MNFILLSLSLIFLFVQVDSYRQNNNNDNNNIDKSNDFIIDSKNETYNLKNRYHKREKKYSSHKKVLDDIDDDENIEKPARRIHSSRTNNRSDFDVDKSDVRDTPRTTTENYAEEASLCINEYDIKNEQLVKVKELENGAHMIRFIRIDEPSSKHGLSVKDICMLNCCVEKNCDLAMLSEQRGSDGYKCYLFFCNGSCTYASHQDYTSMILKKDLFVDDQAPITDKSTKNNEKSSDASSSTLSTTCRSTEFSCRDGTCIPYYDVCNSYDDCPSGVDEEMCSQEFLLHQRTQQENRKKPSIDTESEVNNDIDGIIDDIVDEDSGTTTVKSRTKSTTTKSSTKSKGQKGEEGKQNKNITSYLYNIDLDTQDRVSKLQKLKEHLEKTKGPEAWYHLFQTLIQHQQQEHTSSDVDQTESSSSTNDEDNFKDQLLALEQQWIADRQKTKPSSTLTTTVTTTKLAMTKSRGNNRKTTVTPTTTRRSKVVNENDQKYRRPSAIIEDEVTNDEDEDIGDENNQYYWEPTYDDRNENRYNYPKKQRVRTTTTTRKTKMKNPSINRDSTVATLVQANVVESDSGYRGNSFVRESGVVLILLLGLLFTIILLVLVGFYCRDSWKRGRIFKNRSTDADYLINGLYL